METTSYTERVYPGEFLLSEGNGDQSREKITVAAGQDLQAGQPLGKVLLGAAAAAATAGGGNTGNGTITGLAVVAAAKIGTYTLTCTAAAANAGTFAVVDPDGVSLGNATVAVAFSKNGLSLTVADGSTDFIVGDTFTIAVTPAVAAAVAGNTGNGTVGTVTVAATGVKAGVYKLYAIEPATNLGRFILEDPDGIEVGSPTVGTLFTGGGLSFTIADGATDFVAGDAFTITVTEGSGEYRALNPSAKDGSQIADGILYSDVDASDASVPGVAIVRAAEYNTALILWGSLNNSQITTAKKQLSAKGVVARTGIGAELGR